MSFQTANHLFHCPDDAHKLLSSTAGQHLCATSLVIDEVRSQVAVKRNAWKAEGELARLRLEGTSKSQDKDPNQPVLEDEPEEARKYVYIRLSHEVSTALSFAYTEIVTG